MSDYEVFARMIKGLNDSQFDILTNVVNKERHDRIRAKLHAGYYMPLSDQEKHLVEEKRFIDAIKAYRERNKCSLMEAKFVIDEYR